MKYINKYSSYIKDWRTWYKLFFFALGSFAVLYGLIYGLVNIDTITSKVDGEEVKTWAIYDKDHNQYFDYSSYFIYFFSFFTQQSNVVVIIWFLVAFLFPWKEGKSKFLSTKGSLLVSTYISITALIFWFMLIPSGLASNEIKWNGMQWFTNFILHTIIPISMVIYFTLFMNKVKYIDTKSWFKNNSWLTFIYPLVYGIYILIRGEMRLGAGRLKNTSYPYFFFRIHDKVNGMPGWVWLLIAIGVIFGIAVGFSTLYVYAFNKTKDKYTKNIQLNN